MACAWIADRLIAAGYRASPETTEIVDRWRGLPASAAESGDSVAYLRRSGQLRDFDFIVDHVDDLDLVTVMDGQEVVVR